MMLQFREFADHTARRLPLYRRLADGAAQDRDVAARLLMAQPNQRVPVLLFAAVHDVLLAGVPAPLGEWYVSVTGTPRPVGHGADDPWPHFRELVLDHEGVAERIRTRSTQTNEIGRCTTLLPALAQVERESPGGDRPLGLVEVGASAGLNLLLDRYGYRYEPSRREVSPGRSLVLSCQERGRRPVPVPEAPPAIAGRVGLDLRPVDLDDADQARWLVACQWPDQPERVHRSRAAIALAQVEPPRVVAGDAVDDLAPLVAAVPDHALPLVFATWVLSYLAPERRHALVALLDRLGAARDLTLVYADIPALIDGMPVPGRPDGGPDGPATALVRIDWRDGRRSGRRLADQHPHGTWVEWLDR